MKRTKDSLPLGAAAAAATRRSSSAVAGSRAPAAAAAKGPQRIDARQLLRDLQDRSDRSDPLDELLQLATVAAHIDRATAIFDRLRELLGPARACELAYALGRARSAIGLALAELESAAGIVDERQA